MAKRKAVKPRTWKAWAVTTDYDELVWRGDSCDELRGVCHVYRSRKHAGKFVNRVKAARAATDEMDKGKENEPR